MLWHAVQMLSGLQYNAGQMQYQLPPGVVNSDGTLHPQAQILLAALAAQVWAAGSSFTLPVAQLADSKMCSASKLRYVLCAQDLLQVCELCYGILAPDT